MNLSPEQLKIKLHRFVDTLQDLQLVYFDKEIRKILVKNDYPRTFPESMEVAKSRDYSTATKFDIDSYDEDSYKLSDY